MPRYDHWADQNCRNLRALMDQELFKEKLLPDISGGAVFPAIRKKKIDFYFLGQKICSFTSNRFQANVAYLAAFQNRPKDEVTEEQFRELHVCHSFKDGYTQIKKNMRLFHKPESGGLSKLCKKHSFYKADSGQIGVFDIELSLEANGDEEAQVRNGRQDRIDLVLFNKDSKRLRFFEVKTFANREIWPRNGHVAVSDQIARYKKQVTDNNDVLLAGYKLYVKLMNQLCGLSLPEPAGLDKVVDLLLIGFNQDQSNRIKDVLKPAFRDAFLCRSIGDPSNATQRTLADWWRNPKQGSQSSNETR